jgi:fructoselysine-6-P-deglycase FrlB-like protein
LGKQYSSELKQLEETYHWARKHKLENLVKAVEGLSCHPLIGVGSGGSFTTADFGCCLHQESTGLMAAARTPMEVVGTAVDLRSKSVLLASAGGKNPDVLGAFRSIVVREPRRFLILCTSRGTPLARIAKEFKFVDFVELDLPTGKDGFLATNSLLASTVLLARAYAKALNLPISLPSRFEEMLETAGGRSVEVAYDERYGPLWRKDTTVILHGPSTRSAALDLESKFTEAALGNVQVSDFRNFAHGRHHWLAKCGETTGVLAFLTPDDEATGSRTLDLLPKSIPVVSVRIPFQGIVGCLAALIHVLHIVGSAGRGKGVNPGRPGVPKFGRQIYGLKAEEYKGRKHAEISVNEAVAIERKSRQGVSAIPEDARAVFWRRALAAFVERLEGGTFHGVVLDYDGTLCHENDRLTGIRPPVAEELRRLLTSGIILGIATGRGKSVKTELRKVVAREHWKQVVVGYYNGGDIGLLEEDRCPDGTPETCDALRGVGVALQNHCLLSRFAEFEFRLPQIKIEPKSGALTTAVWDIVQQTVNCLQIPGVTVLRSSHSMDVVAPGITKVAVVNRVSEIVKESAVLCIGDKGQWPGNDFSLLCGSFALSVDEVSQDPATCWNLAVPGHRGVQAVLEYLRALRPRGGGVEMVVNRVWERKK